MRERIRIALVGWNEGIRCLLDRAQFGGREVEVVGVVALPGSGCELPDDLSVPRLEGISALGSLGEGIYLLDLRDPGGARLEGLPPGAVWIPPEGARLIEVACGQSTALKRYREVVETATDAVVTIDGAHRILFFNRAAEEMFGFTKEGLIGEDLSLIIPQSHRKQHKEYVQRYCETRRGRFINHTVELTAQRRSGENFPIRISFSVAEEGGHLLMTAMIRDISELKALERRAMQNERLVSIGQALSYVTHEVKNPLMVIGGFARTLQRRDAIQDEDRKRLDIMVKEVQRLEGLLAETQDFTKPLRLDREEIRLGPFLEEILALFGGSDTSPRVGFSLEIQGDPVVSVDPDRLRQVMLNLIKNAMEAIPAEGAVDVVAWENERAVCVEVRDTGEGVEPERLETIFEPFVTTKKGGSGLGLPLCRKIVQDHGGELTLSSRPGQGTQVRVTLPSLGDRPPHSIP